MSAPTPYPQLNDVLRDLVAGVRAILGANFVGAYLQGSFAVGDADKHSDVDVVVVTGDEVDSAAESALQRLHTRLYATEVAWAQFLYLDNGASELVRDAHCNTAVVRWSLRELGIVLAGPEPKELVAPVSASQLRTEARAGIHEYAAWAPEPTKAGGMSRWKQPYLVLTFCRLLHTLACGRVTSKRKAATWALEALDPQWTELIQTAIEDRPDPWTRVYQPAAPDAIARTLAFADYAVAQSKSY